MQLLISHKVGGLNLALFNTEKEQKKKKNVFLKINVYVFPLINQIRSVRFGIRASKCGVTCMNYFLKEFKHEEINEYLSKREGNSSVQWHVHR